jgi:hypothetical protein
MYAPTLVPLLLTKPVSRFAPDWAQRLDSNYQDFKRGIYNAPDLLVDLAFDQFDLKPNQDRVFDRGSYLDPGTCPSLPSSLSFGKPTN